jgi:xanthine dehydrogenase accessory factor
MMDPIFQDIVRLQRDAEPFALATVVHTSGSTPQKSGARAVFLRDGTVLGTLGGGCMEAEARRRGLARLASGEPELFELHLDDDFGWDDGLICGGSASILIQPVGNVAADPYQAALELHQQRGRGVLCLVTGAADAAAIGRLCLVTGDGDQIGAVPDPALQAELRTAALVSLAEGREAPRQVRLESSDAAAYLEPIFPQPVLFIAGAGHVGSALCRCAAPLGFEVTVVDDRPSLANPARLPDAKRVLVQDIVAAARELSKTPDTYIVLVTRGHRHDAVVLREVIKAPVAYIGMIGSRRKVITIFDEFLEEGLATAEDLARVHAPIGLDIGAVTVEEIAVSIAAELVLIRRRGAGHGDRGGAGGGRVEADGAAKAAVALGEVNRNRDGRSLVESLPRRRDRGGDRPPGPGNRRGPAVPGRPVGRES